MKIGIFGGTFSPPHIGHLAAAERVRADLDLDMVLFVPAFISPHKQDAETAPALDRLRMTRLATVDSERFQTSDVEILAREVSFTIKTLERLSRTQPQDEFTLIIGMDNYHTFHTWKEPKRILQLASLAVMNRPGFPTVVNEVIGTHRTQFVEVPNIDISSSQIRDRVRQGRSVRFMVPERVNDYITERKLFIEKST